MDVREARALLEANRPLIKRIVTFTARRYRLNPDDAEDFASDVDLKLLEDDCTVIRSWKGESTLSTYLSVVISRFAADQRNHHWGKWHPSAEAKRSGPIAVELEQIVVRDGRSIEEAFPFLAAKHPEVTLDSLRQIAARLPRRQVRHYDVDLDDAMEVAAANSGDVEERAMTADRLRTAGRVTAVIRKALANCPADDRLVLQLHFVQRLTFAQIARALQRDQKLLYRRIERCLKEIRAEARAAGLSDGDVNDLIGRDDVFLDFDLGNGGDDGNGGPRPSKESDETVATEAEDPE